jgi:hypothetical protein
MTLLMVAKVKYVIVHDRIVLLFVSWTFFLQMVLQRASFETDEWSILQEIEQF